MKCFQSFWSRHASRKDIQDLVMFIKDSRANTMHPAMPQSGDRFIAAFCGGVAGRPGSAIDALRVFVRKPVPGFNCIGKIHVVASVVEDTGAADEYLPAVLGVNAGEGGTGR